MSQNRLFSPFRLGSILLQNRVVMAPMTRSRAIGNIPNDLMEIYYAQRAGAGLIITEGVSPSANGLGYARIPGIFNKEQINGWKKITSAVHRQAGKIYVQLMHTGRIGHPLNLPNGARILAPSAIQATGQLWTDTAAMQDFPLPAEMSIKDIAEAKEEFVQAAKNAMKSGFDGVELHGANGYLLEQFLSPVTNQRKDEYGGGLKNRARFVLEVAEAVGQAIGLDKTGIRLSPFGAANGMKEYPELEETYRWLAKELNRIGLVYIHIVDHSSLGGPAVPETIKTAIKEAFGNTIILTGGYEPKTAESDLQHEAADLIGFGRPFINNPDLVRRMKEKRPLSDQLDKTTFYSAGEKGYTDYPAFEKEAAFI
jgi:N-ethylmaleimide reductase